MSLTVISMWSISGSIARISRRGCTAMLDRGSASVHRLPEPTAAASDRWRSLGRASQRLLQLEDDRVGAGLILVQRCRRAGQVVPIRRQPWLLEADHGKPGPGERFPVVGQ